MVRQKLIFSLVRLVVQIISCYVVGGLQAGRRGQLQVVTACVLLVLEAELGVHALNQLADLLFGHYARVHELFMLLKDVLYYLFCGH